MRFSVANEDSTVFDSQDTRIGDGDFEDVGGKVFEACFTGTDGLGIDVPVDLPGFRGDLVEEAGFLHFIAELGFEDLGESSDGEIEIDPGGVPEAIGRGEGAARDDVVDMGVKLEGPTPSVKDAKETREICSDELFIRDQFLHCFGGSLEQGRVGYSLVLTDGAA